MAKKLFFLFAATMLTVNVMAEKVLLVDSIVDLNTGGQPTAKEYFLYDVYGHGAMWYEYTWSNGQWNTLYTYRLENEFDAQGRVSRRNETLNTNAGWILMYRTDFTYDEQNRLQKESRWSLSAQNNTWLEGRSLIYQYGESDVPDTILYQFAGGEGYMTYVLVPEESTTEKRVMDTYWTGYEEYGADGRRIYYCSEHTILPPQGIDQVTGSSQKAKKVILNGQLLILRGNKKYSVTGEEIE